MINENQVRTHHNNNFLGVLAGLVIGSIAGAITMLLMAPQSGKDTRMQIQEKGIELRNQTTKLVEDTMAQVRSSANKITVGGREKAEELLQHGQTLVVEQLDHISDAAQAGKKGNQRLLSLDLLLSIKIL
jgi:gas vesicle protein